jgi:integrase/recombinase XerD
MTANLPTIIQGQALVESTKALVQEWLDYEGGEGASQNTVAAYRRGLDRFVAWLQANRAERVPPGGVAPEVIRAYKADLLRSYKPQTVNLQLSALRSFFRFLVNTGRVASNPAGEIKGARRLKSRQHSRDPLTNGEVLAVLKTCQLGTLEGLRDWAILTLMAYCGLREIEIHRANIGNLKTQGDRLVLEVHGKGRLEADAVVIIPVKQEPAIRSWLAHRLTFREHGAGDPLFISLSNRSRGDRLSLRAIRGLVKERYRAAGVVGEAKTAHSLRHSAITNAIRNGATPLQVQAMGRHSSFDTTLQYYHEVSRLDHPAEDLIDYSGGDQVLQVEAFGIE